MNGRILFATGGHFGFMVYRPHPKKRGWKISRSLKGNVDRTTSLGSATLLTDPGTPLRTSRLV